MSQVIPLDPASPKGAEVAANLTRVLAAVALRRRKQQRTEQQHAA